MKELVDWRRSIGTFGVLVTFAIVAVAGIGPACAECPPCGPETCLNDPGYPASLEAKKKSLRTQGYPDDLITLLDRDGACIRRVLTCPDGFSLKEVTADGATTLSWTEDGEEVARKRLRAGKSRAYYKFNVSQAFACCGQERHEERPDWDAALELNHSLVIECSLVEGEIQCK